MDTYSDVQSTERSILRLLSDSPIFNLYIAMLNSSAFQYNHTYLYLSIRDPCDTTYPILKFPMPPAAGTPPNAGTSGAAVGALLNWNNPEALGAGADVGAL